VILDQYFSLKPLKNEKLGILMTFFHTIVQNFTNFDGFHVDHSIGGELTLARVLTFGGMGDS
jgi:hypothetical protein